MPTTFAMCEPECARTSYSDDERRELVRRVWEAALVANFNTNGEKILLEEFLKEQGL